MSSAGTHTPPGASPPTKPNTQYKTCKRISESKAMEITAIVFAIWALTGDDIKLWTTNKPADLAFDIIVYVMIVFFSAEIVLGSFGKEDYYMGFFFILDVISTVTLFLDLSWSTELLVRMFEALGDLFGDGDDSDDNDLGNLRSSKTARAGAKFGRVLRVVRLVRILKLYKAYMLLDETSSEVQRKNEAAMAALRRPDPQDEWDEDEPEHNEPELNTESRVGKRLSELTTRRVIFLILTTLFVMPLLQSDETSQSSVSVAYASDEIYSSFTQYLGSGADLDRYVYEESILTLLYYHNWFADCKDSPCPEIFSGHPFWVGLRVPTGSSLDLHDLAERAQLRADTVDEFQDHTTSDGLLYNMMRMPGQAVSIMQEPWSVSCSDDDFDYQGMSLLQSEFESSTRSVGYTVRCPEKDLRLGEYRLDMPTLPRVQDLRNWTVVAYSDLRGFTQEEARRNILVTIFVCFLLCQASWQFSHDANMIILKPLERIMIKIQAIRENPLIAVKMADAEYKAEEQAKARRKKNKRERAKMCLQDLRRRLCTKRRPQEPLETVILEKTIVKLGSLLALGLGEAGANIICSYMEGRSSGNFATAGGERIECVVGVARVRHFSTATEVLKGNIVRFVNQIAEIVHSIVCEYHGAPNKNDGEMFLIIWRTKELDWSRAVVPGVKRKTGILRMSEHLKRKFHGDTAAAAAAEQVSPEPEVAEEDLHWHRQRIAELAVCALVKIVTGIQQCPTLAAYRCHPGLQLLLGPACYVDMSFGLHCGWAIEGAIGSNYKIEASYVSPDVTIAMSVEKSTKTYNVPIIVTEPVAKLCSKDMFEKLRLIDHVMITGSLDPLDLFSMDLDYRSLPVDSAPPPSVGWTSRRRFKARQLMEGDKVDKMDKDLKAVSFLEADPTFAMMRQLYTVEFMQLYKMGFYNYIEGEWRVARRMLESTKVMLGADDGPSAAVLDFMEQRDFEAGSSWAGVRELPC